MIILKNKEVLLELLHDADDFANFKRIECPPIYFLGGSGCILGSYIERATLDVDFVDLNYEASVGKIFRLFDKFDMLDLYVTSVAEGFEDRATKLPGFAWLEFYVLSAEDIIVSKISRYSEKDKEDIEALMTYCNSDVLNQLIINVIDRVDLSQRIKAEFLVNSQSLKEQYSV